MFISPSSSNIMSTQLLSTLPSSSSFMTSTSSSPFSSSSLLRLKKNQNHRISPHHRRRRRRLPVSAADTASPEPRPPPSRPRQGTPGVDTRIHWDNQEDGWIGGKSKTETSGDDKKKEEHLGERFADLINSSSPTHYQFLGVSAEADAEEIKAAYRRLSKEYHPDTTTLPLKAASEKFMQLREAYNVLSDEQSRRFYDWSLAQEEESRRAQRLRMRLEDPYEQEIQQYESVPDAVDRLGGRNMELSDQAYTALTVDIFIMIFSLCCFVYAAFFKDQ